MPTVSEQLENAIRLAQAHGRPRGGAGFGRRADALDYLEVHVVDRLRLLEGDLLNLSTRADALSARLTARNARVTAWLRRGIRERRYRPDTLKYTLLRHSGPAGAPGAFDALDLLVAGLLDAGDVGAEQGVLEREMVAYQPTPARAIIDLVERVPLTEQDVLYDLGSGLGRVVILTALLTAATAKGVDFEPAYCEYARRAARMLNVENVHFIQSDARVAPIDDGTVFFMFTPFRGALMDEVLERLRALARQQPIRVCTYGPCTRDVARQPWLAPSGDVDPSGDRLSIFASQG